MNISARQATGISLLLLAALLVIGVPLSAGLLEHNPRDWDEIGDFLEYIYDNETLYGARMATVLIKDAVVSVVIAAGIYLSFYRQNRGLAFVGAVGIAITTAAFLLVDGAEAAMIPLARDYVEGGAAGVEAGDPSVLQMARMLAIASGLGAQAAFASFGVALFALGALFIRERGQSVPPAWVGYLAIVVGACWWLLWLSVFVEAAFVFIPVGALAGIIWMIALGVWLLRNPDEVQREAAEPVRGP